MPVALTDAIPLMQPNGIDGRNNARDIRTQLLSAQLLPDANGVLARPGVLPRRYITGFGYVDLKPIQLGTPGSAVQFYPGKAIVSRTGQGPYVVSQETTVANYPLDNADPSNNRIDALYCRMYDHSVGDNPAGLHGPYLEHINGTPGGSPVAPSIPTDALLIAHVLRPAGVNNVTNANITDMRRSTGLIGAPRNPLPGDSNADAGLFPSERRIRMASPTEITAGADPFIEEIWCTDAKWRPTKTGIIARNKRSTNVTTSATTAATAFRIFNVGAQVYAGRTYEISGRGSLRSNTAGVTAEVDFRYTLNGVDPVTTDTQLAREIIDLADANVPEGITWEFTYDATTDATFKIVAAMFTASGGGQLIFDAAAGPNPGEIYIEDKGPTVAITGVNY